MSTRPMMGIVKGKDDCQQQKDHFDGASFTLGITAALVGVFLAWAFFSGDHVDLRAVCRQAIAAQASQEVLLAVCK